MSKLEEAKEILSSLKVPAKQQNGMCCCVLLAMANLTEEQAWGSAANNWIRIHDVIAFANSNYGTTYAENSRETFRKQAMHHFRNAAFIEDNGKATNSPNYRYRLTDEMLRLIQSFGTANWERSLARFMENHDSLVDLYASKRTMRKMPVKINGEEKQIAGMNLLEYLKEAGFEPERVVVERNLDIIPKDELGNTIIQDEDVIEVLRFVGGG